MEQHTTTADNYLSKILHSGAAAWPDILREASDNATGYRMLCRPEDYHVDQAEQEIGQPQEEPDCSGQAEFTFEDGSRFTIAVPDAGSEIDLDAVARDDIAAVAADDPDPTASGEWEVRSQRQGKPKAKTSEEPAAGAVEAGDPADALPDGAMPVGKAQQRIESLFAGNDCLDAVKDVPVALGNQVFLMDYRRESMPDGEVTARPRKQKADTPSVELKSGKRLVKEEDAAADVVTAPKRRGRRRESGDETDIASKINISWL